MMTAFGKFCRKLRIDLGELLKDMADKLEVTPAYLSAVEIGKRKIPKEWLEKITYAYTLDDKQQDELKRAFEESQTSLTIDLNGLSGRDRNLAMVFAREFESLDEREKEELLTIFKKRK